MPGGRHESELRGGRRAAADEPLHHVEIGGKVLGPGDDHAPARDRSAGREHLEQIDRRRVGDGSPRRDGRRSAGRSCRRGFRRRVDPPGAVPAPDEPLAPLALDDGGPTAAAVAFGSGPRSCRRVEDARRQHELLAHGRPADRAKHRREISTRKGHAAARRTGGRARGLVLLTSSAVERGIVLACLSLRDQGPFFFSLSANTRGGVLAGTSANLATRSSRLSQASK